MNKLSTIALLTLAALGLHAATASAHIFGCCCGHKYTIVCKPYNAFSPPCCTPCGTCWPCAMGSFTPASPYPPPIAGCPGCGTGAPGMGAPPQAMPPATAAPGYMPPAPAEVGEPQTMLPGLPYGYPGVPMQPVVFQGYGYPAAVPPAMGGYPMPGMMPGMMPGYGYPAPMMMTPGMR